MGEILLSGFVIWCFYKFCAGAKNVYGDRVNLPGTDNGNGLSVTVGEPYMEYVEAVPQQREEKTPKVYVPRLDDWSMACGCIYRENGHRPAQYCGSCGSAEKAMRAMERQFRGYGPRRKKA